MNDIVDLPAVEIRRPIAIGQQLTDAVRGMIRGGRLKPGARLPSSQELARRWETDPMTVHRALTPLVKEGLLSRVPKRGTFVRQREAKLTCVGIYLGATYAESAFRQAVQAALKNELQRAGIEPDIWIDPRPEDQRAEPWMPLVRAVEQREFQALIVAGGEPDRLRWLRKLPVTVTALGGMADMLSRVNFDYVQLADASLQALARQGCRSAGLILPVNPAEIGTGGERSLWFGFCERFLERAGQAGVTVRNEWVRLLRHDGTRLDATRPGAREHERYGYEEFRKVWRRSERPQGLVVYPDTTARGVILGVREQHVRVPAELKLVLHKNEATDLFCPMPATLLVLSEREIARALVRQVQKQFRGETCAPVSVLFRPTAYRGNSQQ